MKLQHKHVNVLKAALHELDLKWRNGTANAGLSEESMRWLRIETCPHESDARFLLDLLEKGFEVRFDSVATDSVITDEARALLTARFHGFNI